MTICCVKGCGKEQFPGCGLNFHCIPENPELKEKWLKVLPLEGKLSKSSIVCSSHFKYDDYVSIASSGKKIRCLKQGVIPSIFSKVEESNQPESGEESDDEKIITNNLTTSKENEGNHSMVAYNASTDNKTNNIVLVSPRSDGFKSNKVMVVTPISTVNRIEDLITIKSDISNEHLQASSSVKPVGTSVTIQKRANKMIVVKPIEENVRIEETISTKSASNIEDSDDISSVNESLDSDMSSDDEKSMVIPASEEIYSKKATPERTLKRKYVQGIDTDMYGSKVPCNSSLEAVDTNLSENAKEKPIKYHVSTQTGPFTTNKEQDLRKKIKALRQKINRRVTSFNQMKTVLDLIKNKCRNYTEVKEVLTLKLKQLPENLNCDGVIVAP